MPITKVPLVHKFGIISLSEAERIIRQQRLEKHKARRKPFINKSTSCPVITADFITKYNSCFEVERENLNSILKRVLEHAKYKSCCSDDVECNNNSHDDVDLSEGWLELIMICQCCGPLQEESLMSLYNSLSSCTVSPSHIPALFYISGLCFYWLKTETTPSILRSGELLLLKVLHRVCWRLYLHHMINNLQELCSSTDVQQLKFDMEGFEKCEQTYHNFPEALLHWRIAMEVGSLICDKYTTQLYSASILSVVSEEEDNDELVTRTPITPATDDITKSSSITSAGNDSSSGCGHSIAPVLWHALDIWQCNRQEPSALPDAIQDFFSCNVNFKTQQWLEGLLAIEILCEAAKLNEVVLHLVQSLAAGNSSTCISTARQSIDSSNLSSTKAPSLSQYKSIDEEYSINGGSVAMIDSSDNEMFQDGKPLESNKVTTLNVLGMQPTFLDPEIGSQYTSYTAIEEEYEEEELDEEYDDGSSNTRLQDVEVSASGLSVDTQALLDMESIPDTPLTTQSTTDNASIPNLSAINSDLSELKEHSTNVSLAKDSSGLVDIITEEDTDTDKEPEKKRGRGKKVTLVSLPRTPVSPPVSDSEMSSSDVYRDTSLLHRIRLLDDRFEVVGVLKNQHAVNEGGPKSVTLKITSPRPDSRCTHYTHSTAPFSWIGGGVLGSHVPPSTVYQHSILSLSQTIGSDEEDTASIISEKISFHCFKTWPIEIQLSYTLNMGNLVVNGSNSNIQRMALVGPNEDSITAQYSLNCLKDYENLTDSKKSQGSEPWYIRHCVILALCRICELCKDQPTQDGMSEIAWNTIQQRITTETEAKVLEAQKLHHSCCIKFQQSTITPSSPRPSSAPPTNVPSVFGYMAGKLATLYLPDVNASLLTHVINKPNPANKPSEAVTKKTYKKFNQTKIKSKIETQRKPVLTQHKPPHSTYIKKTSAALNDIARKHWELQMKLEDEDEV